MPKSISEHITPSASNISLNRDSHLSDDSTVDQSQFTSVIEPISSDLLTTQDLNSVGQELHAGAYSNDTNKNMEASPVLTGDSVQFSPISQVDLEMPSQANRDDAVTHPISMETASASTAILMLDSKNQPTLPVVSQPQNTSDIIHNVIGYISSKRSDSMEVDHPTNVETSIPIIGIPCLSHQTGPSTTPFVLVEDSSEKSVDETNSSSNLTAIHQWLQPVQIVNGSTSQSVPTKMSNEALDELCVDQVEAMSKIAQHLLTSNLSNSDYKAILLCHKDDMDQVKDKTVNEDERDGNVDAWLSGISDSFNDRSPRHFEEKII